jgi:hypothetical protein
MWFEILSVAILVLVAVVVASSRMRNALLAYGYRGLQILLVVAVLAAGLVSVNSPSGLEAVEECLTETPLLSWVTVPEGWPEGAVWLLRGLIVGGVAFIALTLAQFLRDIAKITAIHEAIRGELQAAYKEINDNAKHLESSGGASGRLGEIAGAVDQIKHLLKRC